MRSDSARFQRCRTPCTSQTIIQPNAMSAPGPIRAAITERNVMVLTLQPKGKVLNSHRSATSGQRSVEPRGARKGKRTAFGTQVED